GGEAGHRATDLDRSADGRRGEGRRAQDLDAAGLRSGPSNGARRDRRGRRRAWGASGRADAGDTHGVRVRPDAERHPPEDGVTNRDRWLQLAAGFVCMGMSAALPDRWAVFVPPIDAKYHWGRTGIQIAFTVFVATETWLVPVEGWFVDRFGPRLVVMFGGVVVALAWTLNAYASSLWMLYAAAAVAGVGAGAVYGT